MQVDSNRAWIKTTRERVALAAAACAVVALLAWFALERKAEPRPAVVLLPDRRSVAAPLPQAMAAASAAVLEASSQTDEVQACGGTWLKMGADGKVSESDARDFRRRSIEATRGPTLAAMESSPEPRAQAAAQVLEMADGDAQDVGAHRNRLARLARDSTDPQVYAWAYRACGLPASAPAGDCQFINVEQWARLDPSNGMPWLVIAGEAEATHDMSTLDDAMFHMASAERQDSGWGALPATVLEHVPAGESFLPGALALEVGAIGIDAAVSIPYLTAMRYCATAKVVDANRRQTCERIAALLVERSTAQIELGIGASIGKRSLGWSEDRNRALADEGLALREVFPQGVSDGEDDLSCAPIRRELNRIRDFGKFGEVETLRRAVAASGKKMPQLAEEFRKSTREAMERSIQEAPAASTPTSADSNR